jgi:hypothetical protein
MQGEFPLLGFSIGLTVTTLLVSGLLWHFQRRHVLKID